MQMVIGELAVAAILKCNIKIIIMDNRCLGMIREYQHSHYENRYNMVDLENLPDYSLIAKAYDIPYLLVSNNDEVAGAIKKIKKAKGPVIAEIDVDSDAFTAN